MKRLLAFLLPRSRRIVTIVVNADENFLTELDSLAANSNCSRAEIIDRAIQLYAKALDQAKQGKVIEFSYPESSLMRGLEQARKGDFVDPPDLDEGEKLAAMIPDESDELTTKDGFLAVVNKLAVTTRQSKAEVLRNAVNCYHKYVWDLIEQEVQAEIDAHRKEKRNTPPTD